MRVYIYINNSIKIKIKKIIKNMHSKLSIIRNLGDQAENSICRAFRFSKSSKKKNNLTYKVFKMFIHVYYLIYFSFIIYIASIHNIHIYLF